MRVLALLCVAFGAHAAPPLPAELSGTDFRESEAVAYVPQSPLWSDGAEKRRWIALPPGTSIDTSRADAWDFPPGTKAWKEFSHRGRKIETRFIERLADGGWRYATYLWNAEGTKATLAPAEGAPGPIYPIPSRTDCLACHEGAASPILGYSAVQLSSSIAAGSSIERAALGYLHANCGHCHNDAGPLANVGLSLAQRSATPHDSAARTARSVIEHRAELLRRLRASNPYVRMPPLGVRVPDAEGIALVERWISQLHMESSP